MVTQQLMVQWMDGHAHLDRLAIPPQQALEQAAAHGVTHVIHVAIEPENWRRFAWFESLGPGVWISLGLHPHEAHLWQPHWLEWLKEGAQHPQVIALGEMGLDYAHEFPSPQQQWEVFEAQLALAAELGLPVQIHSREAESDTRDMLKKFKGRVTGILHCFTGSYQWACQALDWGFRISLSGIVTFKNAQSLREVVKRLPLEALLIETDSPFLSPHPWRGQPNTPHRVSAIGAFLAQWLELDLADFSHQLMQNWAQTYPRWKKDKNLLNPNP